MKNKAFNWLACTAILLLLVSVGALAADDQGTLAGVFNDFTPAGTQSRGGKSMKGNVVWRLIDYD
jgi:hypothetical protein